MARVLGAEHVDQARARNQQVLEILPGDIVTDLAIETAARLGIELVQGPLEKPSPPASDGHTRMRRSLLRRSPRWLAPKPQPQTQIRRIRKLALVGAGGVGSNVAHLAANAGIADEIALIDVAPGLAAATALDLDHAAGITRSATKLTGSQHLADLAGAEIVVVTAGRPRTPGMARADLIAVNRRVIHQVAEVIKSQAPQSIVITVTNPLDEMTDEMLRATGFPRERVLGMAGTLDSSRFRFALAQAAGVQPGDVEAITLGSHGDEMAPVISLARIKGRELQRFLSEDAIAACARDAITGGGQIVALKRTGSATLAPAHAVMELIEHICGKRTGSVPVSVMLKGEYGIHDVVLGVPAHLGATGVLQIDELELGKDEHAAMHKAAAAIRKRLEA